MCDPLPSFLHHCFGECLTQIGRRHHRNQLKLDSVIHTVMLFLMCNKGSILLLRGKDDLYPGNRPKLYISNSSCWRCWTMCLEKKQMNGSTVRCDRRKLKTIQPFFGIFKVGSSTNIILLCCSFLVANVCREKTKKRSLEHRRKICSQYSLYNSR